MIPISAMSPPESGMIAPLPNCFSIAAIAPATAFIFSLMLDVDMEWLLLRQMKHVRTRQCLIASGVPREVPVTRGPNVQRRPPDGHRVRKPAAVSTLSVRRPFGQRRAAN